ncbi:MAG: orotidine-5'-phosphate decarboxylase [Thermodesulfobacteriota bacterium]|nr:orotidine-5'-phosphate decarboxylase [Thermodesulfobacteriota bacterium]
MPSSKFPPHFADRLFERMEKLNTRVCVGLDPDLSRFPKKLLEKYSLTSTLRKGLDRTSFERAASCILEFNKTAIDAVCDFAAAVKPQSAHYERFGSFGIQALHETVVYAREKGLLVILDVKRNDIGSTAEKYASAYLGPEDGPGCAAVPSDAVTVNPYLGLDGIRPFMELCAKHGKGIFVLVKTSNPSGADIQDLALGGSGDTLALHVASLVNQWGSGLVGERGYSAVGAVAGATHPEDMQALRERMPQSVFLLPGYGAQGAKAEDVRHAFKDGFGALVASSRAVIYPCPPETDDFWQKIKDAARSMRDDLNQAVCP